MRILRILLTAFCAAIAVVAGMFIAAVGLIAFGIGRLIGRPRAVRTTPTAGGFRRPAAATGDVIDVTATEVPEAHAQLDSTRR